MGLIASIYKDKGQSFSAGGISSQVDEVTVVNAEGPFDHNDQRPPVLLVTGPGGNGHVIAVPAQMSPQGRWIEMLKSSACRMCGGTFIYTSDSRFHELIERLGGQRGTAIGFHDRFEA